MDAEETLSLQLLAALEELSSENDRLRLVETALESKVAILSSRLDETEDDRKRAKD